MKRLAQREANYLCFEERITLIKATLLIYRYITSLHSKYLKVSQQRSRGHKLLPLERSRSLKQRLINWKTVPRGKKFGGLALGGIVKRIIMLFKWLWRVPLEQQSLWVAISWSRFEYAFNTWDTVQTLFASHRSPWEGISQVLPLFLLFINLSRGFGNLIRFWNEHRSS